MTTDLSFGDALDGFKRRERMAVEARRRARTIEGKRYDATDVDDFHDDLRVSYDAAMRNGLKTPGLPVAHFGCRTCAALALSQRSTF